MEGDLDPKQMVDAVLAGELTLAQLERIVDDLVPSFRRPRITPGNADDYAAWEHRMDLFAQAISDLIQSTLRLIESDAPRALFMAKAIRVMSKLLPESSAPGLAAFLVGYLYWRQEQYFDAIEPLEEAISHLPDHGRNVNKVDALLPLADSLRRKRDLDSALARADEAVRRTSEMNVAAQIAAAMHMRGQILADLGREEDALAILRQSVEFRRRLSETECRRYLVPRLTAFLSSRGEAARRFGHLEEAVSAFLEVAELKREGGRKLEQAWALSEIGYAYCSAGEEERGRAYLRQAVDIGEAAGGSEDVARWRRDLEVGRRDLSYRAELHTLQEAYEQLQTAQQLALSGLHAAAIRAAKAVLQFARGHGDPQLEIASRSTIAKVHSDCGELDSAIDETRGAIVVADRINNRSLMLGLRENLANGLARLGENTRAVSVLLDGIVQSQLWLVETEDSDSRQAVLAGTSGLYEQYSLLASHGDQPDGLLWVTEQARARNLGRWMEAGLALEQGDETNGNAAAQHLQEMRAVEVELEVRHLERRLDSDSLRSLKRRRELSLSAVEGSRWSRARLESSMLDDLLRSLCQPGTAVTCLFAVPEGVCVALLSGDAEGVAKSTHFVPWEREERLGVLAAWTRDPHLARGTGRHGHSCGGRLRSDCASSVDVESFLQDFDTSVSALASSLLDKLAELVASTNASRLVVVPHRELCMVPFTPLLERCPSLGSMSIAPSLQVLALCARRQRSDRGETLLIRDPTATLEVQAELDLIRAARGQGCVLQPNSVEQIGQLAPQCTLLHAATHGFFFPDRPYHSGLAVSQETDQSGLFVQYVDAELLPVDRPTAGGACLLTAATIMAELSLSSCRLAVLSACQSGVARDHGAGEMTGLPASLLAAGAKSVIASLWPVDDNATSLMMRRFYANWTGGTGEESSPAKALCDARAWLRGLDRASVRKELGTDAELPPGLYPFANPFFADAFQCYGSW